ncbi:MAG: hypothetical protein QF717_09565 [SAR202 cluster bacterium]|nr:hypothetical protein [SAR202 cluster bacterium]MDP7223709.1 hypothetical protein [SAR202 cluster bacterium]MDP7532145.1 hypothetical protein [SAR202 cluster bacterium]
MSPAANATAATDLTIVELDPKYAPYDVSGERYVSVGRDRELHLVDINTGESRQLTTDGQRKREPAISGNYVAWIDQRKEINLGGSSRNAAENTADDIYLLNLETDELRLITDIPAKRRALRMSDRRLVWMSNRNELGEHYTHFDIYAYDVRPGEEIAVTIALGLRAIRRSKATRLCGKTTATPQSWELTRLAARDAPKTRSTSTSTIL